ncbi:MAG: ABC transporter permease [Thermoguttaceae bacterium]|jgi:ABC-type polysaccharide/polyol phosphate export permease
MATYLASVWSFRYFWFALVRNDLRNRYRRSVLGVGWSLLQPIATTAVLCLVFARVFHVSVREYAPLLLIGLTFWGFITTMVNDGCNCFFQGESYIRQHRAPLAIYPLRTALGGGYHFLIGLGVVMGFIACVRGFGNLPALLSLAPTLLLLFIFGWSLAVCAGVCNVMFHDTQHIVSILLQILFYLTPIMYPSSMLYQQNMGWAVTFNPLAVMLELVRAPVLDGQLPSLEIVGVSLLVVLALAAAAGCLLKWCERSLVFYL